MALAKLRQFLLSEGPGHGRPRKLHSLGSHRPWLSPPRQAFISKSGLSRHTSIWGRCSQRTRTHCPISGGVPCWRISPLRTHFPSLGDRGTRYLRLCVAERDAAGKALRQDLTDLRCLTTPPVRLATRDVVDDGFLCGICSMSFPCKRTLAVHRVRRHGQRTLASQLAFGTRCQVCSLELWSETRLKDHLRKSPRCLRVYDASDITPDYIVPSTERGHAFKPAIVPPGPQPWWATLFPD